MARARSAQVADDRAEFDEVKAFYRRRLTGKAAVPDYRWKPVCIGPSWQLDGDRWLLPERSLGWEMLAWTGVYLQASRDEPWVWTDEQARFLLHWYAVDEAGRFVYRDGVLQRLKGFGKDPIGAGIGMFEQCGPNVVADFGADGQPVGVPHEDPWVQIAAVSLEQTKNTMRLLPSLASPRAVEEYRLMIGKESAYSGNRFLQAVTSSPATLQGARSTFVLLNETHEWISSNGGHDMEYVLQNNSTKSKGGAARTLRITNAYEPGLDSVAEHDRDAYDAIQEGRAEDVGLLYDSLEAAADAPLTVNAASEVVRSVRGDSTWLDVDRIVQSIADVRNPPSKSRRFWYNQIVAAEDAWVTPNEAKAAEVDEVLDDEDQVFLFGDGSKSDDASGLVAVRLRDGLGQVLHVQHPHDGQLVDRQAYDAAVIDAMERFQVLGFWFDPSHAKDSAAAGEDDSFWRPLCDEWMRRYGRGLKLWAQTGGEKRHAVIFDMAKPSNMSVFVTGAEQTHADFEGGVVRIAKSAALQTHLKNARRSPGRFGCSVRKEHRESRRKIDLAVCLIGARAMWRKYQLEQVKTSGRAPGRSRVIVLS